MSACRKNIIFNFVNARETWFSKNKKEMQESFLDFKILTFDHYICTLCNVLYKYISSLILYIILKRWNQYILYINAFYIYKFYTFNIDQILLLSKNARFAKVFLKINLITFK